MFRTRRNPNIRVVSKALDLVNLDNVSSMITHATDSLGPIDVLANVAGMFDADAQFLITERDHDRWARMHALNTTSLAYACQVAVGEFKKSGKKGVIINIGSTGESGTRSQVSSFLTAGCIASFRRG